MLLQPGCHGTTPCPTPWATSKSSRGEGSSRRRRRGSRMQAERENRFFLQKLLRWSHELFSCHLPPPPLRRVSAPLPPFKAVLAAPWRCKFTWITIISTTAALADSRSKVLQAAEDQTRRERCRGGGAGPLMRLVTCTWAISGSGGVARAQPGAAAVGAGAAALECSGRRRQAQIGAPLPSAVFASA